MTKVKFCHLDDDLTKAAAIMKHRDYYGNV